MLCQPTGSGKTVTFASIAQDAVKMGSTVMIAVDRKELLEQAVDKLKAYGVHATVITGGRRPSYAGKTAFVATVQTLVNRPQPKIDLLIIDEAHKQTFDKLLSRPEYSRCFVIGATATPVRTGKMTQLVHLYDELVESVTIPQLIDEGFLVPALTYAAKDVDVSKIKTVAGDYDVRGLFQAFDKMPLYDGVVDKYENHAPGSKAIVFNINVEHSMKTAEAFKRAGHKAAHVDGSMSKAERESILAQFKYGIVKILCNCDLFTTGYDEPSIETVIVNRATKSLTLWLQMCGRGSRPYAGKNEFTILDMGGNVFRLGFWEQDRVYSLEHKYKETAGVAPVKECDETKKDEKDRPGCGAIVHASVMTCPYCAFIFPKTEKKTVKAEFALILNKTVSILPDHLKGDQSRMSLAELEEIRVLKKYSIGWLVNQVARRKDITLDELAAFKGYKRNWVEITRQRLEANAQKVTE